MHKAECLIEHVKTKDGSSTRSLDYLPVEHPAEGISEGRYTYKHLCEGGVDIHDIVVKKSSFRILLYYIGTICLLATVCRTLLSKEGLYLSSLWSILFAGIIAKCLRCDRVKKGGVMRVIGDHADFWGSIRATLLEKLRPPAKILVPIWKALRAFTNSDSTRTLADPHPQDSACSPESTLKT